MLYHVVSKHNEFNASRVDIQTLMVKVLHHLNVRGLPTTASRPSSQKSGTGTGTGTVPLALGTGERVAICNTLPVGLDGSWLAGGHGGEPGPPYRSTTGVPFNAVSQNDTMSSRTSGTRNTV